MGLNSLFRRLFPAPRPEIGVDELARRLDIGVEELRAFDPAYREFSIPKRSGGRS